MNEDVKKVLISEEEITERCKELGKKITEDYAGKEPVLHFFSNSFILEVVNVLAFPIILAI